MLLLVFGSHVAPQNIYCLSANQAQPWYDLLPIRPNHIVLIIFMYHKYTMVFIPISTNLDIGLVKIKTNTTRVLVPFIQIYPSPPSPSIVFKDELMDTLRETKESFSPDLIFYVLEQTLLHFWKN